MFAGFSAFPITPADANGRVDVENLAQLADRLVAAKVRSIGLLGSTGTYMYLDAAERLRATKAVIEAVAGRVPVIVSVGALRSDSAIALAKQAESLGATGLIAAPVSYTPLTQAEAFDHFSALADATGLGLCLYNNPSTTHFTFDLDLIARLAAHPKIAAIKMPPVDDITQPLAELRQRVPTDFVIGYSGDWCGATAMLAGADAWYSAIGGILPGPLRALSDLGSSGHATALAAREAEFAPLWEMSKTHGSLRIAYGIAHILGLTKHDLPRPLQRMSAADYRRLETALSQIGVAA